MAPPTNRHDQDSRRIIELKYSQIIQSIRYRFSNNRYHCTNAFLFDWESDYFSVTTTEYSVEVEVKVSRSDFRADFKKYLKHRLMQEYKRPIVIIKHPHVIKQWDSAIRMYVEYCRIDISDLRFSIPNRFYYACPKDLLKKEEMPPYAGLLYIESGERAATVVKQAPLLHKGKFKHLTRKLMDKFYWKSISVESERMTFDRLNEHNKAIIRKYEEQFGRLKDYPLF